MQLDRHQSESYPVIICGILYEVEGKRHVKMLLRHHGLDETQWRKFRLTPLWFWN